VGSDATIEKKKYGLSHTLLGSWQFADYPEIRERIEV